MSRFYTSTIVILMLIAPSLCYVIDTVNAQIIRKTLEDNAEGHLNGWNPNGELKYGRDLDGNRVPYIDGKIFFEIKDNGIESKSVISTTISGTYPIEGSSLQLAPICVPVIKEIGVFVLNCINLDAPLDDSTLTYLINNG